MSTSKTVTRRITIAVCPCGAPTRSIVLEYVATTRVIGKDRWGASIRKTDRHFAIGNGETTTQLARVPVFTQAVECGCGRIRRHAWIEGRVSAKHKCDARCLNATGHSCECSCGGANHGAGYA